MFGTAVKKVGTRIATMLALKVLLEKGLQTNDNIIEFIEKGKSDSNQLLVEITNEIN